MTQKTIIYTQTLQVAAATQSVDDSCKFARSNDSASAGRDPPETNWCMYDDEVDLRIIVLTFNRRASLLHLLRSDTSISQSVNQIFLKWPIVITARTTKEC